MKNKITFLCLVLLLTIVNAFADTLTLKSGETVEGKILQRNNESVKIEAYGVELTYYTDQIDKVNNEKFSSSLPPVPVKPIVTEENKPVEESKAIAQVKPSDNYRNIKVDEEKFKTKNSAVIAGVGLVVIFIILLLVLAMYIYSAICLYFIAKKTNQEPAWLAWVPIGNLVLMCKITSLHYLWLLGFLAGFIPFVGAFIVLGVNAYFWYKIALVRNKPSWLGILTVVPILGFVIMGYLAFSE